MNLPIQVWISDVRDSCWSSYSPACIKDSFYAYDTKDFIVSFTENTQMNLFCLQTGEFS